MEILLIILIIATAGTYLIKKFLKTWRQGCSCRCGCSGCNVATTCSEATKNIEEYEEARS